ncbi:hypothetical protein BCR34DRAFT_585088 [Clohesyomyces aquaticus]|uniref:Uncharacterized protein n=1 Tax=Clohesyomyces aquaticus TaxID=1231657 RepID=A0A1Y1ZYU2_9PLEO|nr:hypothetical protein BCR34DRAFT_585088 [Clohesyomyces aquaticus]
MSPQKWQGKLSIRDGRDSCVSVQIFLSKTANAPGSISSPNNREPFEQKRSPNNPTPFGLTCNRQGLNGPGQEKEVLIVVKRGLSANTHPDLRPYRLDYIRRWSQNMSWSKIEEATNVETHEDGIKMFGMKEAPAVTGSSQDVNEITWPESTTAPPGFIPLDNDRKR